MTESNGIPTLFNLWSTPVKVHPGVVANLAASWGLVERGHSECEAEQLVRAVYFALGTACTTTTTGVLVATLRRGQPARQRWLPALGLVAAGGIAIAAALDTIR